MNIQPQPISPLKNLISFNLVQSRNIAIGLLKEEYFSTCYQYLKQIKNVGPLDQIIQKRKKEIQKELWIFSLTIESSFLAYPLWCRLFKKNIHIPVANSAEEQFSFQKEYMINKLKQWNSLSGPCEYFYKLSGNEQQPTILTPFDDLNVLKFLRDLMRDSKRIFCGGFKSEYEGMKSEENPLHNYLSFTVTSFQSQEQMIKILQKIVESVLFLRFLQLLHKNNTIKNQSLLKSSKQKLSNSRQIVLILDFKNIEVQNKKPKQRFHNEYFTDIFIKYVFDKISTKYNVKFEIFATDKNSILRDDNLEYGDLTNYDELGLQDEEDGGNLEDSENSEEESYSDDNSSKTNTSICLKEDQDLSMEQEQENI